MRQQGQMFTEEFQLHNPETQSPSQTCSEVRHTLYNGDCLQGMATIADGSAGLVITDPPYNLGLFMQKRNAGVFRMRKNHFVSSGWDDLDYEEWDVKMRAFLCESFRVLRPNGSMIIFMSLMKLESLIAAAQAAGFYYKTVGIWHKTNPIPRNMKLTFVNSTEAWVYFVKGGPSGVFNNQGKLVHDFFESSLTPASEKKFGGHPTQKPLKLVSHFVELLSNPDDLVVDPFMGSGTSGVACQKLGRKFFGIELEKDYVEVAAKRLGMG